MIADTFLTPGLTPVDRRPAPRRPTVAIAVAVGAFALFCVAVLTKPTKLLEPDDSAYLASILALTHGHITLSSAQYEALLAKLSAHGGTGIMQWIHLPDGRWMSEKNPGYPFFAAPFQILGILRSTVVRRRSGVDEPVRRRSSLARELGRHLGCGPVRLVGGRDLLCVASDNAVVHRCRTRRNRRWGTLWTFLADDARPRRRTVVGLLGFVSLRWRYSSVTPMW